MSFIKFIHEEFEAWSKETGFSFGEDDCKVKEISSIIQTGQLKNAMKLIMSHFVPSDKARQIQLQVLLSESRASSVPEGMRDEMRHCRTIREFKDQLERIKLKAVLSNLWYKFDEYENKIERISEKLAPIEEKLQLKRKKGVDNFRACQSLRLVVDNVQPLISQFEFLNNTVELVSERTTILNRAQDKLDNWKKNVRNNMLSLDKNHEIASLSERVKKDLQLELPESELPTMNRIRVMSALHRLIVDSYAALTALEKSLEENESKLKHHMNLLAKDKQVAIGGKCSSVKLASEKSFIITYIENANSDYTIDFKYEELKKQLGKNRSKIKELCENCSLYTNFSLDSLKESLKRTQERIKGVTEETVSHDIKLALRSIPQSLDQEIEMRLHTGPVWGLEQWNLQCTNKSQGIPTGKINPTIKFPDCNPLLADMKAQGDDYAFSIYETTEEIETRITEINNVCDLSIKLLDYWKRNVISESLNHDKNYVELRQKYTDAVKIVVELEKES